MFTGLVEGVGGVAAIEASDDASHLVLDGVDFAEELALGESVAVNGCCLTVTEAGGGEVHFDILQETLRVTNLGALKVGSRVNLERALKASDRLGGHYVQGHIDCVSAIETLEPSGQDFKFEVALPGEFAHLVISRGSIAVNGISLTIAAISDAAITMWITPHTRSVTNLAVSKPGDPANLEFDVLAKYVERQLGASRV